MFAWLDDGITTSEDIPSLLGDYEFEFYMENTTTEVSMLEIVHELQEAIQESSDRCLLSFATFRWGSLGILLLASSRCPCAYSLTYNVPSYDYFPIFECTKVKSMICRGQVAAEDGMGHDGPVALAKVTASYLYSIIQYCYHGAASYRGSPVDRYDKYH
ncbi:hypothetical protein SK128_009496 [Halocaridina rubra]|uniref:Uncharacterized protein n=1 Tax=Halocaridina rubra TaxID=373956 RepID=A0AAN8WG78_HALRR